MYNLKNFILFTVIFFSYEILLTECEENASISDFPYHVSVQYNNQHTCSGSFITERWILTVAACVYRNGLTNLTVRLATNISSSGGDQVAVRSVIIHDDFNSVTYDNDIALLYLSSPTEYGDGKFPIVLPTTDYTIDDGTITTLTGWPTDALGNVESQLTVIYTPIVNQTVCSESLPRFKELTDSMLCAGNMTSNSELCQGDSGSPLVYEDQLVGLLSYGLGCTVSTYPSVYTRISSFVPWILSNTGILL